jgi:hypothetical protein
MGTQSHLREGGNMHYLRYTYVDTVTGVPVSDAPATNGPRPPVAGLVFGFALESQYPTTTPIFYGTAPDDADLAVPGVLETLSAAAYAASEASEQAARLARDLSRFAAIRWERESRGVLWNGWPVASDEISQAKLTGAVLATLVGARSDGAEWKFADGVARPLTNANLQALGTAVAAHVQACYSHEASLAAQRRAGAHPDPWGGWPEDAAP